MATNDLAYRMPLRMPEVAVFSSESDATQRMYGIGTPETEDMGRKFLLTRRLIERGVRFVQVYNGTHNSDYGWDAHNNIARNHRFCATSMGRPLVALLEDLKRTGLLSQTLKAAEEPHPLRDLHATILHQLGLNGTELTYYFNGRHQRLTDNGGEVLRRGLG